MCRQRCIYAPNWLNSLKEIGKFRECHFVNMEIPAPDAKCTSIEEKLSEVSRIQFIPTTLSYCPNNFQYRCFNLSAFPKVNNNI